MPEHLIEADQLPGLGRLQLLDATPGLEFTQASRIYGRVRTLALPMADWVKASLATSTQFEQTEYWQTALRSTGVNPSANLVVFDDGRMTEAARIWFLFQYLGLPIRVLNGGSPELERLTDPIDGHGLEGTPAATPPFQANTVGLVGRNALKAGLGGDLRILDCRTPEEWSGENRRNNPRSGHLPGAVLLPHQELLEGTRLKPVEELRELLEAKGFQNTDCVVSLCNGGGRAALSVLAAVLAGFEDVNLYYRGFADWSRDPECPLVQSD